MRRIWALAVALAVVAAGQVPSVASSGAAAQGSGRLSGPLQELASQGAARSAQVDEGPLTDVGPSNPDADGPGSLIETSDGVLVQVFSDALTPTIVADLKAAGARVVDANTSYDIATISAAPGELAAVAAVPGVRFVREVLEPLTHGAAGAAGATGAAGLAAVQVDCGAAHSEGDAQLRAASLRTAWDVEGAGVEVGVLSDSWNVATNDSKSLGQDVQSGDIPGATNPCPGPGRKTPVPVLEEGPAAGAYDEGRAMAQIVHDLAPAAEISFATAFTGDIQFADNIRDLRAAGADVIVDDVFYFNEPAYQNGPIGVAVEDVVAGGVPYFSAIGNETVSIGGDNVSSYEAPAFRPVPCPGGLAGECHDFDPGPGVDTTFGVTVAGLLHMTLKWNEPWSGVLTNLDLHFMVDGVVTDSATEVNPGDSEQPFESLSVENGDPGDVEVEVVVQRPTGTTAPRFKLEHIRSDISDSEYRTGTLGDVMGPNTVGHPSTPNGVAVAAARYDDATRPEWFSNTGPATWYYGPVNGSTPAQPLVAPQVMAKPDVTATDAVRTTFFFDQTPPYTTTPRFSGTSAAAPHAAAVAALLLDCNGSLTPAQITAALEDNAAPMVNGTPASVGEGLIDARAAGDDVCLPPPAPPSFRVSDASVLEGNGGFGAAKTLVFTVSLTQPLAAATSVRYATANGTAGSADYTAKTATTLSFAKNQTSKTVSITVKGDTAVETNETVLLNLSNPVGAPISDPQGVGTIVNDDVPPVVPVASVGDVSVLEGNGGFGAAKTLVFTVTLSAPAPGAVSVKYQTGNGLAVAPGDYTAKALTTLSFSKGQTSKTVSVTVKGDKLVEANEWLYLVLSSGVGVTIGDGSADGVILNDD